MKKSILAAIALLAIAFSRAQLSSRQPMSAIYTGGALHISLATGTATMLHAEVIDPEDHIVARGETHQPDLAIPVAIPLDELVWHRLRYRIVYKDPNIPPIEEITSLSRILHRPSVHVLSQPTYLSGGPAAVRVVVAKEGTDTPIASGSLDIDLVPLAGAPRKLYSGHLNKAGTTSAEFRFPAALTGAFSLHYTVDTPEGEATYSQPIHLEDQSSILLTTEKPVYQPGQTIHARALALDRATHAAVASRNFTFEMEDARGNRIFRKATKTDAWGVASAEFALAAEVNLGAWHLRAVLDQSSRSEITLNVERYVLPRFKVAFETASKRGYRPGDHVTGTVHANYFFGKPVDHAEVTVTASGQDVAKFEAGKSTGSTDADGAFHFDLTLPNFFAGHPLNNKAAVVLLEAAVKDNSGHTESHVEPVTVTEAPILITAIPESESIVPGLENRIFVLTTFPDGTPARTEIRVQDRVASTDQSGVAIVPVIGPLKPSEQLRIDAKDSDGNHASATVNLVVQQAPDQILLHADRAIYKPGERIRVELLSQKQRGSAYIDILKDRQTIATHDVEIVNGRANLDIPVNAQMAGTVELNAYIFGHDGQPIGDHHLLFIQPADELRIETSLDAPAYKPGEEARIGFHVTDRHGGGVQAALGVEIVDQAVFALAEKQPGFAKVFFYLEQEAMKPRYEVNSLNMPEVISSNNSDRAAQALFAAAEPVNLHRAAFEFGSEVPREKWSVYYARYRDHFERTVDHLAGQASDTAQTCGQLVTTLQPLVRQATDAWGTPLRMTPQYAGARFFTVQSAGPDTQFNSADDLSLNLQDPACGNPITVRLDSGRRPANESSDVAGVVTDGTGALISGAVVRLAETTSGRSHTIHTSGDGLFHLASLPAGVYTVTVEATGFNTAKRVLSLHEGDRASLSVRLSVGIALGTVMVEAATGNLNFVATGLRRVMPAPMPQAMMMAPVVAAAKVAPAAADTHVRSWFPESLYIAPEIITDRNGRGSITVPIADNITTWRLAMLASTTNGALGSGTSSLKVFQDFFTEMDLPVTLTQGDEVSIPIAVYNYSGANGNAHLQLDRSDWFSTDGNAQKTVQVESGRVGASQFTVTAKRIGKFKLTLRASLDGGGASKRADIVVREIEVVPNGREQSMVFNGRLDSAADHNVSFPPSAIPDASAVVVRLYPGPMSQIVEGMDSLLRMPGGCFEQTSSSTYPNVLALDYMKRTKKTTPEIAAKAEGYISGGYQRLVTFEVPGGGFSWFGQAPANKILTSYGLMEFSDMSKVHDVDKRLIERTRQWLAAQQQPDGSWKPDTQFINEGATNRFNNDALRITAYIAWALETTGYQGPAAAKAKQYVEGHMANAVDPYTLAVIANFAADGADNRGFTDRAIGRLLDARIEEKDQAWWKADETSVYATGNSAAVETTGLAVQALIKSGTNPAVAAKAMNFIVAKKSENGAWGTTQATIMALRALMLASEKGSGTAKGAVEVLLNGKTAATLALTEENNDLFHQYVFKNVASDAANRVELRFKGEGTIAYQVVGRWFAPWDVKPAGEPLSIEVAWDRTRLEQDQLATATATVRNNLAKTANMVMVDLGIPPGFDLLSEDLDSYRDKTANLEKYSLTATQAILYFDVIPPSGKLTIKFRLRAKYPIRAASFASRVYEYYTPEINSAAPPVHLEVRRR